MALGQSATRVQRTACIMKNAILPAIVEDMRLKRERQASSVHSFFEDGSQKSSQDSHAADECYDRGILSMDGDFGQIEAILADERLTSAFREANVELFKFAAGASMTQQPNDRSRCFYCLKKALREHRHAFQFDVDSANTFIGLKHKKVLRSLGKEVPDKGQSKASFATFNFFLLSCDAVFSQAFTVGNIRGGWMKCGLAPFNPRVMMESYAFFPDLEKIDPTAHQQVLDAIPKLAVFARETGVCTDAQMEAELGALFSLSPAFAAMYNRPVDARAPVNHRRCVWLSNPSFLDTERAYRQQKIDEAAAAVAAAAMRAASRGAGRAAAPRPRSAAANADPVIPDNSAPALVSDIPWCFPCKWTGNGVEIVCASYDKKKSQHVVSGAHKIFLEKVAAEQARAQSVPDAGGAPEGLVDDPLDAGNLALSSSSRPSEGSSGSESDSDSDSDSSVEGELTPVAGAARSPSSSSSPPPTLQRRSVESGLCSLFRALLIAHARCRCRRGCFFSRWWCSCFAAAQTSLPNSRRLSPRCSVRSAKLALVNKKCARE